MYVGIDGNLIVCFLLVLTVVLSFLLVPISAHMKYA